jgi:hypothetical protein
VPGFPVGTLPGAAPVIVARKTTARAATATIVAVLTKPFSLSLSEKIMDNFWIFIYRISEENFIKRSSFAQNITHVIGKMGPTPNGFEM